MAKDRKPDDARPKGGATRSGGGNPNRARTGGRSGRARPPTQVVANAHKRPWGLIAAALAVVVFAVAVIGYAVVQVNEANADKISSADQIDGLKTYDYGKGQGHVPTEVAYAESPPVGGQHDGVWADCTGTVYDIDIRNENAVHSLEHGGLWITYDPELASADDVDTLTRLVEGVSGRMLSPRPGLGTAVSLQSWDNQLKVESATDPRVSQFADFFTFNADSTPELGATCERPEFVADPTPADPGDAATGAPESTPATPPVPEPTAPTGTP